MPIGCLLDKLYLLDIIGYLLGYLLDSYEIPMGCLLDIIGYLLGYLLDSYEIPMGCLLDAYWIN